MLKRTLIILSMTIALIVAAEPLQTVHGIIMTQVQLLALDAADAAHDGQRQEDNDSSLARALKAPFRAIGRLFGRGKKNRVKLERISEKDAKRFESAPVTQVGQTTPSAEASSTGNARANSMAANAIENVSPDPLEANAWDHLEKGRALLNDHDLNGAIWELSTAASLNPKLAEASSLLGVAYWRKGLRDVAQRSFETAVRIDKDDPQNLNNLGFLLYENGDYKNATEYLKRAAKLAPKDPLVWNNLGLAQSERGHFDDAYESFARAQGEYKGHLNVAARLEHQGSPKRAIKHLEKALALQPNSPDVLARLINLYDGTGNEKQAASARNSLLAVRALANASASK